ncbi:glycerophosphoryl diester phosphodiesterase [Idiomarina sp. A28L]|uniref:glycerophosphodiester phosphodiesterase family protein n=1 Tax=Idiomarina sp. A28L TaxID=1036674 RepID=UPI0002138714|nr:glycerophosphodiester phosphodiesterase family protein [Idiomarina sp. A28L]EGN74798.1 glycerophosphoryl diester phosphodiesterase [Idiomarina sp. A28L]
MIRFVQLKREILASIRYHRRALLAFHLYFALLLLTVFTPLSVWLLRALVTLSGETLVGNEALLGFMFNPSGMLWLLVSVTFFAVFIFLQHAGMILITSRNASGKFHTAAGALWLVVKRLKSLLALAGIQVAVHLALLLPLLAIIGFAFQHLLGGYDIYFVINAHPPEFWQFMSVLAIAAIWVIAVHGSIHLRWVLALPCMLIEECSPLRALRRSAELTKGSRHKIAYVVLTVAAVVALLPILISLLFDTLGWGLFQILPAQQWLVLSAIVLLLFSYTLTSLVASCVGVSINSLLMLRLYHRYAGKKICRSAINEPRNTGLFAIGIEAVLVIFALVQVGYALQVFNPNDEALNIAHRGNSWDAPENTLAAVDRAIHDGADYIELDVRHTADGELVIIHDRDLLRIAGDHRPIWDVNYTELSNLDVGSWFASEFADQRLPTLAETVELMRGRAGLYLEIKGAPEMPNLVPKVVAELQRLEFINNTILASLAPNDLWQAREIDPELRTSLLVHTSIGRLEGQPVDALALRAALVTPSRLSRVRRHGHELHVWILNDTASMARMVDLGVDGIITDRPDLLTAVLAERAEMNAVERWLYRFKHWIW